MTSKYRFISSSILISYFETLVISQNHILTDYSIVSEQFWNENNPKLSSPNLALTLCSPFIYFAILLFRHFLWIENVVGELHLGFAEITNTFNHDLLIVVSVSHINSTSDSTISRDLFVISLDEL